MRTVCNLNRGILTALSLILGIGNAADAFAVSPHLTAIKAKIDEVKDKKVACTDPLYATNATAKTNCTTKCQGKVEHWRTEAPKKVDEAIRADEAVTGRNATAGAGAVAGARDQVTSATNQADNLRAGRQAMSERGAINTGLASALESCASEVHKACKDIAPADATVASKLITACETGQTQATAAAATNKTDGLGLGDLGKGMDLATKALGLAAAGMGLMNAANQGGQSATDPNSMSSGMSGATAPTPSSLNGTENKTETANLGTGSGTSTQSPAVSFGSVNGQNTGAGSKTAAGSPGAFSGASGSAGRLGAGGSSNFGAGPAGSGVDAAGGSFKGGGAAMSSNSTGSSRPGDGSGAGAGGSGSGSGNNFEVPGNGGGRPMLGLKGGKSDIDEFTGADAAAPALASAELGARELASNGEEAAAANDGSPAESIFARVRSKYANLKTKGRF